MCDHQPLKLLPAALLLREGRGGGSLYRGILHVNPVGSSRILYVNPVQRSDLESRGTLPVSVSS
jgi:hypothetical protein